MGRLQSQTPGATCPSWSELKRRHVVQVTVAHAVVGWLVVQVLDVVNEPLNLPNGFDTVVIVLVAVGLPIAVVLAWAYDLTSHGVVRTPPTDPPAATATAAVPGTPPPAPAERPEPLRNSVAVLPSRTAQLEALAIRDAEQALSIDPSVGAAHWILARIHQFNWRGAEAAPLSRGQGKARVQGLASSAPAA
jgi:hypothetical protein